MRSRFREMTEHLKNKAKMMGIPDENFAVEVSGLTVGPGGHTITPEGLYFADFRSRGAFYCERITLRQQTLLLLQSQAFLDECDDTRNNFKLPPISATIVPLDDDTLMDLLIEVDFIDPVYLAPLGDSDANGAEILHLDGADYLVGDFDLWIAEKGEVVAK